jgi:hypothetical protein
MYQFEPTALLGVYMSRSVQSKPDAVPPEDITYLRFAFCGVLGQVQPGRRLDIGIVRTLWLSAEEVRTSADRHRSPLVWRCVQDYLAGQRFPLPLIHTDQSVFHPLQDDVDDIT